MITKRLILKEGITDAQFTEFCNYAVNAGCFLSSGIDGKSKHKYLLLKFDSEIDFVAFLASMVRK